MDKVIYKVLSAVRSYSPDLYIAAGTLVFVDEWCGDFALVRTCEDYESVESQIAGWVKLEDIESTEES